MDIKMPPVLLATTDPSSESTGSQFLLQLKQPQEIFALLLLLGSDVISAALAQNAGYALSPVVFSFGWVAYACNSLLAVFGSGHLLPPPTDPCLVINTRQGHSRQNSSWIIGRLWRDYEYWQAPEVTKKVDAMVEAKRTWTSTERVQAAEKDRQEARAEQKLFEEPEKDWLNATDVTSAGLVVGVYNLSGKARPSGPLSFDRVSWSGLAVLIAQLVIAAVPLYAYEPHGNRWGPIFIVGAGNLLAFLTSCPWVSQLPDEKWGSARMNSHKEIAITSGNGAQHVILIVCKGSIDLEDLSTGQDRYKPTLVQRIWTISLALSWFMLLLLAAAIETDHWYILAAGALGIVQNIYAASAMRTPRIYGLDLEFSEVVGDMGEVSSDGNIKGQLTEPKNTAFGNPKVINTLYKLQQSYKNAGSSLAAIFFPAKLRKPEQQELDRRKELYDAAHPKAQIAVDPVTALSVQLPPKSGSIVPTLDVTGPADEGYQIPGSAPGGNIVSSASSKTLVPSGTSSPL